MREINVTGRPIEVRHADVVHVYQTPVTINNYYGAPSSEADASEEVLAD